MSEFEGKVRGEAAGRGPGLRRRPAWQPVRGALLCCFLSAATAACSSEPGPCPGEAPPPARTAPAEPATGTQATQPRIHVDPSVLDLGDHWTTEEILRGAFTVHNQGTAPLTLLSVESSCGCLSGDGAGAVIPPGESLPIPVELEVRKQGALILEKIALASDDPERPRVDLKVVGKIREPVTLEPRNAPFFGDVGKEETRRRQVRVVNHTPDPMVLALTRNERGPFTVRIEPVEEGKEFLLEITARPPYRPGANTGRMEFSTGLPARPVLEVRPQLRLVPRLVYPEVITVPQPVPHGYAAPVSLRNNGERPVTVQRVTSTLPGVTFRISAQDKGRVQNVEVRLPAGLALPSGGGELWIHTDDPEFPRLRIAVLGAELPETP